VKFSCDATDDEDTTWEFSSASYSSETWLVDEYPDITHKFMSRHSVLRNYLSIDNVQICDAGRYSCTFPSGDNSGNSCCSFSNGDDLDTEDFELIVVGKYKKQ